jgi:hypothetical protein
MDHKISHPLSSHPTLDETHKHNPNHTALMTGAGALAGTALARHHDKNGSQPTETSSLTGRRSWDASRHPQHPQSILANPANRRSIGSTNSYVQARNPKQARFSDELLASNTRANQSIPYDVETSPYQHHHHQMAHARSNPQLGTNAGTWPQQQQQQQQSISPESPNNNMPGSWRGSGDFGAQHHHHQRGSLSPHHDQQQQQQQQQPQQSETGDNGWYRGRYMGDDVRPVDSPVSAAGSGSAGPQDGGGRFYAANANRRSVGQAM